MHFLFFSFSGRCYNQQCMDCCPLTMQTCPVNDLIVLKQREGVRGSGRERERVEPTGELAGALGLLQNHCGYISKLLLHHWTASNLAVKKKNSFVIRDYLRAGPLLPTTTALPTGHRNNTWGVSSKPSSQFYWSQTELNYSNGTFYTVCEIKQWLRTLKLGARSSVQMHLSPSLLFTWSAVRIDRYEGCILTVTFDCKYVLLYR